MSEHRSEAEERTSETAITAPPSEPAACPKATMVAP